MCPEDGFPDLGDASPFIEIFSFAGKDIEALKDVDNVVNSASLYLQLLGALVEGNHCVFISSIQVEKPLAQFSQALVLPVVLLRESLAFGLWRREICIIFWLESWNLHKSQVEAAFLVLLKI